MKRLQNDPPTRYELRYRTMDKDGNWSAEQSMFHLSRKPLTWNKARRIVIMANKRPTSLCSIEVHNHQGYLL